MNVSWEKSLKGVTGVFVPYGDDARMREEVVVEFTPTISGKDWPRGIRCEGEVSLTVEVV